MDAPATDTGSAADRDRWYEKSPGSPLDRFPLLGEALAATAKAWTDSFSALAASPGEFAFKGLRGTSLPELTAREGGPPILASIRVAGWEDMAGLALGRPLLSMVVEALFGGGGGEQDSRGDARPVSPVEMRIVDVIGGQAATALTAGFKAVVPQRFEFDRVQVKPEPRCFGKPGAPLLAATFEVKSVGATVPFDVVLPLSAFAEHEAAWTHAPATAPDIDDTRWTRQLRAELARADVTLRASMAAGPVTLGAIAGWRVGDVLELPPGSGHDVVLTCEDEALFRCDLGQSKGRYTVRIEERSASERPSPRKEA